MTDVQTVHPVVKAALEAMKEGDRQGWFHLFADEVTLTDDGIAEDFVTWADRELFGEDKGYLKTIDRVEDNGLTLYGTFYSDHWGEFETFMKFQIQENEITQLDVGQV